MMEVEYIMQVPGEDFLQLENPCPMSSIPKGATTVKATIVIQEHREILRSYHLANNVNKACAKLLLDAFSDKFMSAQVDPIFP
jgi:hypothetical protein